MEMANWILFSRSPRLASRFILGTGTEHLPIQPTTSFAFHREHLGMISREGLPLPTLILTAKPISLAAMLSFWGMEKVDSKVGRWHFLTLLPMVSLASSTRQELRVLLWWEAISTSSRMMAAGR